MIITLECKEKEHGHWKQPGREAPRLELNSQQCNGLYYIETKKVIVLIYPSVGYTKPGILHLLTGTTQFQRRGREAQSEICLQKLSCGRKIRFLLWLQGVQPGPVKQLKEY